MKDSKQYSPLDAQMWWRISMLTGAYFIQNLFVISAHSLEPESVSSKFTETAQLVADLVAESKRNQIVRKHEPGDPLAQAEIQATGLASDVTLYSQRMVEIIVKYAERDDWKNAEFLADQLPGNGAAMAHAELSVIAARKGSVKDVEKHAQAATQNSGNLLGVSSANVKSNISYAWYLAGNMTKANEVRTGLEELDSLLLDIKLHRDDLIASLTLTEVKQQLALMKTAAPDASKAEFMMACAKQQYTRGKADLAEPFLDVIGSLALQNGMPNSHHVLLSLARTAWMAGKNDKARKSLNLFLKCCESYSAEADWKVPYTAEAVGVLNDWKEASLAKSWIKKAQDSVNKMFILDAPKAILAVAKQIERIEGSEAADMLVKEALIIGEKAVHPRSKASAGLDVCLYYADAVRPLPERIQEIFNQKAEEADK